MGSPRCEVIAIASGKGGTGKTLIGGCLGFALTQSGHRVLMIDADTATYGLSLYLLGPSGKTDIREISQENTWRHTLLSRQEGSATEVNAASINRNVEGESRHGVTYQALIADLGIYGDDVQVTANASFERMAFRRAVRQLLQDLRDSRLYDYIVIDTRGGFSFESTDLCALADSFLLVTDADYTSFYQDRNLMRLVSQSAQEMETTPLLRGILVNRATEGEEESFRLALQREFDIPFEETHPIPLDLEALKAYKIQACPYVAAPDSHFSYATLTAFRKILRVVTADWPESRAERWNQLVERVSTAIEKRNKAEEAKAQAAALQKENIAKLDEELRLARLELGRTESAHQREIERLDRYLQPSSPQTPGGATEGVVKSLRRASRRNRFVFLAMVALLLTVASMLVFRSWSGGSKSRLEMLQVRLYDVREPAPLRLDALKELQAKGVTDFSQVDLSGLNLSGTILRGLRFSNAELSRTVFEGADLTGADLRFANLRQADLSSAILQEARLDEANLERANLESADLQGASLDTDLSKVRGLTEEQVRATDSYREETFRDPKGRSPEDSLNSSF